MNKVSYEHASDEELIDLIHKNDQFAMEFLLDKYKNLVKKKAKTLYLIGGDKDDLIQEGMIGLYKAIRDYQNHKMASFMTFADLCVSRQMYSAIKLSNTKKNQPLNNYVPIDQPAYIDKGSTTEGMPYAQTLFHGRNKNPEEMLIDKENTERLENRFMQRLSDLERNILQLYLKDNNYAQIAKIMNKDPKAIDNGLQRIKKKLNETLKELK